MRPTLTTDVREAAAVCTLSEYERFQILCHVSDHEEPALSKQFTCPIVASIVLYGIFAANI